MPELPEVETTRRGIQPALMGKTVTNVIVREPRLRWPVPKTLGKHLIGQTITDVGRRGKYLLLEAAAGHVIIHLGMSGSLCIVDANTTPRKHDHVDIILDSGRSLRLHDPRRFGAVLWTREDPARHKLLSSLGPEPITTDNSDDVFNGDYLYHKSRGRRRAVREFIMDSHIVVGIGNIYANEALFLAGIDPRRGAGRISRPRYRRLATAIRDTLLRAIDAGGTTLRDFSNADGNPGYFQQTLNVYGRQGQKCPNCGNKIARQTLHGRSLFYCARCQR
ncbi:MAG: bifunctional DNA-formamidopyrimidine glycosylase/DNA-(apurinic or apyrimidinic site) lyase [Acidiferrobacterales bacterium]